MPDTLFSFEVGGCHITAGVFRESFSYPEKLTRIAPPQDEAPESFLACRSRFDEISLKSSEVVIGVAFTTLAPFDYSQVISLMTHKLASLYKLDLRLGVTNQFKCSPDRVLFCNDAEAFLLGEVMQRQRPPRRVIGVTPGTGTGWISMVSRIYADGRTGLRSANRESPGANSASSSYVFGTGAFLLAGSERLSAFWSYSAI